METRYATVSLSDNLSLYAEYDPIDGEYLDTNIYTGAGDFLFCISWETIEKFKEICSDIYDLSAKPKGKTIAIGEMFVHIEEEIKGDEVKVFHRGFRIKQGCFDKCVSLFEKLKDLSI